MANRYVVMVRRSDGRTRITHNVSSEAEAKRLAKGKDCFYRKIGKRRRRRR